MIGIDCSELFGIAQDGCDVFKTPPERIVEPYDCVSIALAERGKQFTELSTIDRTNKVFERVIIALIRFATDILERSKQATLTIIGAISTVSPSRAPVEEEFYHVQNDRSL